MGGLIKIGLQLVQGIWSGISSGTAWIKARIKEWVGDVVAFFQKVFHIGSPSKLMRDEVGKFLALGIGEGFVDEMGLVERMMQNAMPDVGSLVGPIDIKARRGSGNGEVLSLLREIRDNIGNDMYIDGGTLVGYIDKAMGRRAMQRSRGNA